MWASYAGGVGHLTDDNPPTPAHINTIITLRARVCGWRLVTGIEPVGRSMLHLLPFGSSAGNPTASARKQCGQVAPMGDMVVLSKR
jgi:hypothetical protein